MNTINTIKEFLTVTQAAGPLGLTRQAVSKAIREKRLRATRKGKLWMIHKKDMEEFKK